jgi:hypothetical protein
MRRGGPTRVLAGVALVLGVACSDATGAQEVTTVPAFANTAPAILGPASTTPSTVAEPAAFTISPDHPWFATAEDHRSEIGERFTYDCPGGGPSAVVWGTDIYTDDSSVCTAAVHAGAITLEDGGTVTIEIREGLDSYLGTTANEITTGSYGAWEGSFEFVD